MTPQLRLLLPDDDPPRRSCPGHNRLPAIPHELAADEDFLDADRQRCGIVECRPINHGRRIEQHDVGDHLARDPAAVAEMQTIGRIDVILRMASGSVIHCWSRT